MAFYTEFYVGVFLAPENAEQVFLAGIYTRNVLAVDSDDSVAGLHAGFVGAAAVDYFEHVEGVVDHLELNADAVERAFEVAACGNTLVDRYIGRVRVEIME